MVLLPRQAPAVVPVASLSMAWRKWGMLPFMGRATFCAKPMRVPSVSNMLTNSNEKMTMNIFRLKMLLKSN